MAVSTILAGQDGQTAAGVPIRPDATLVGWGNLVTIADTIEKVQLVSQDQLDPVNGQSYLPGTGGVQGIIHFWENLPFKAGGRSILAAQNTGAANTMVYYMDHYNSGSPKAPVALPRYGKPSSNAFYSTTFGGALTAVTWGSQAFAPSPLLPAGTYAILGARVTGLTNYGLLRYTHADFGAFSPGFPVVDTSKASARATVPDEPLLLFPGYQFVVASDILKQPECPVFTVSAQGTGLLIEMAAITTDTPVVTTFLARIG